MTKFDLKMITELTETSIFGEKWSISNRFLIEFTRKVICFTRLTTWNSTWHATTMCDLIKITIFDKNDFFSIISSKLQAMSSKLICILGINYIFLVSPTLFHELKKADIYTTNDKFHSFHFHNLKIIITFLIRVRTDNPNLIRAGRTRKYV